MAYTADLHLHSRFAYATSKNLSLDTLAFWAGMKGIDLLATGDFTHPLWRRELKENLIEVSTGLYRFGGIHFVLGTEVSCVFTQGGRNRRLHLLLYAPSFETVARLTKALASRGNNLEADGRPTLRVTARDLTALALDIDPSCLIVPAHLWTPWYGLLGSKWGFDRLDECFLDLAPSIHAVETGLSSDPQMNWGVPELVDRTIVSFSDAHSPEKLGRELTVFDGELSYSGLAEALKHQKVSYTVEFYPEEGKYHYSGHRKCGVSLSPEDTQRTGSRCPVCQRPLTLGVLHRVRDISRGDEAASRDPGGFIHGRRPRPPFIRLVPLTDLIAAASGRTPASKGVQGEYRRMVGELGSELQVLVRAEPSDLERVAGERLAQAILKARAGDVLVEPGYDGMYGKLRVTLSGAAGGQERPAASRRTGSWTLPPA